MEDLRIKYNTKDSKLRIKNVLLEILKNNENIVIMCIGTDRSTGDSLAPLVGTFISRRIDVPVIGTLEDPVHAKNLELTIKKINLEYNNPFIITIGGCLGNESDIGEIRLNINKKAVTSSVTIDENDLFKVGYVSILGIVNYSGSYSFLVLQNTRLYIVFELAKVIANSIIDAFNEIEC